MGFDSRHLVLEFLAENRNLNIQQMTLVFFGKKNDPFLQESLNEGVNDKLYVYHSKGTRLFWKEYGYEKLTGSIIELLLDTNSSMNITKKELNFKLTEPYYFLDLRNFDFEYLSVIPVLEEDELVGYALLYGYQVIEEDKYPLVSLRRLFRNIVKNENVAKYNEFDELLAGKIGYLEFNKTLYISKKLAEELNVRQKVEEEAVIEIKKLIKETDYFPINSFKYKNYQVIELELDNRMLLAIDELNKPKSIKEFTLFYVYNTEGEVVNMFKAITEVADAIFPKTKINYYKVSDYSIVLLLDKKYLKKVIKTFKQKLKTYHIVDVRNDVDININANLFYIVKYLEETKCQEFSYEEYKQYRIAKEELNHYC